MKVKFWEGFKKTSWYTVIKIVIFFVDILAVASLFTLFYKFHNMLDGKVSFYNDTWANALFYIAVFFSALKFLWELHKFSNEQKDVSNKFDEFLSKKFGYWSITVLGLLLGGGILCALIFNINQETNQKKLESFDCIVVVTKQAEIGNKIPVKIQIPNGNPNKAECSFD